MYIHEVNNKYKCRRSYCNDDFNDLISTITPDLDIKNYCQKHYYESVKDKIEISPEETIFEKIYSDFEALIYQYAINKSA